VSVESVHENISLDTVPFSSPKSLSLVKFAPTEGAHFAEGTTNHLHKYTNCKKKLLNKFVEVLRSHPEKYARYIILTTDVPPSFPFNKPTEVVFVLLRGDDNRADKIRQLNAMIIDWVSDKRLKKSTKWRELFPSSHITQYNDTHLFASVKDYYQWSYSQEDFCFDGGYNGFFAALCKKRRAEDVSYCCVFFQNFYHSFTQTIFVNQTKPQYGNKSKNVHLSAEDAEKIDLSKFNEDDPNQHMMKVMFGCGVYCMFRG
jgi:hypothetical protein